MPLEPKDLELIGRLISNNADDIAVSIARSFERLEERIDTSESRLHVRVAETEDKIDSCRQDIVDGIGEMRDEIRDFARTKE